MANIRRAVAILSGIAGLAVFLGIAIGVVGFVVMAIGDAAAIAIGVVLLLIGLVAAVAGAVFGGATRGVFGVALYHYVADNQVIGPFTGADLEGAARTGKR